MQIIVQLEATSKRAKDRIASHGELMELLKRGIFNGEKAILVQSLRPTAKFRTKWRGWFTEKEVKIEKQGGIK